MVPLSFAHLFFVPSCPFFTGDMESYDGYSGVCGAMLSARVREAQALLAAILAREKGRRLVLLGCSGGATVADALCTVRRHHLLSLCTARFCGL